MKQVMGQRARMDPMRGTVTVRCAVQHAFRIFTEEMSTWWPLESYSRAVSEFEDQGVEAERLEFQPRMGGSLLEHMSDGRTLPWAEVIAWHPPHRVVMAWRPHSMPEPPTELEVTFTAADRGTLVELEHRGWERLSDDFRATLYDIYARGWNSTLELFVAVADRYGEEAGSSPVG
jgi:uncharacterized protein YndB with AHSA1/START domain